MEKKLKTLLNGNKGYALPAAMIMLALLMGIAGYLVTQQVSEYDANMKSRDYEICLLIGKNAMELVAAEIESGKTEITVNNCPDPNGGEYSYDVRQISEHQLSGEIRSKFKAYQKVFIISCEVEDTGSIKSFNWNME